MGQSRHMLQTIRQMPPGVLLLLGYAFLVLTALALTLPIVVDEAVVAPISFIGIVWMLLLAYLIFTMTLVLQRKQAAFGLSLGLVSLLMPLALLLVFAPGGWVGSLVAVLLFVLLLRSLRRPRCRAWFAEA